MASDLRGDQPDYRSEQCHEGGEEATADNQDRVLQLVDPVALVVHASPQLTEVRVDLLPELSRRESVQVYLMASMSPA